MFLIEATNITEPENSKFCRLNIDRTGIRIIYKDSTVNIPINKYKNIRSISPKSPRRRNGYQEITENKLLIDCKINDIFQSLTFSTDENCDPIIYWLRENIRADSL